jgi:hypothetical protein
LINAHGNSGGIKNRSIEEIAEHISIIDRAIGEDSNVKKVSLVASVAMYFELRQGHFLLS